MNADLAYCVGILRMKPLRLAAALLIAASGFAQTPVKTPSLKVTISDVRATYNVGDSPKFKVTLTNVGDRPIYVPKTFGDLGGGVAGFSHKVTFISWKSPEIGCGMAGDAGPDQRSPQQVLKESYISLRRVSSWGGEFELQTCEFGTTGKYPAWGKFRIDVSYWPRTSLWKEVAELPNLEFPVATEEVKAEPFEINIIESPEQSSK
jgi:hypothetical protein